MTTEALTRMVQPVVDEFGDRYAVYAASAPTVRLTAPMRLFLADAREIGLRPVLITRTEARITLLAADALRDAGARWAVQARHGALFDAFSGRRVASIAELLDGSSSEDHPLLGHDSPPTQTPVLRWEVSVYRRVASSTRIGRLSQRMIAGLDHEPLDRWGLVEPLLDRWDEDALTDIAHRQMPTTDPMLGANSSGAVARTTVLRTPVGLLETSAGAAPVNVAELADHAALAGHVLADVSGRFLLTVGTVSSSRAELSGGDLTRGPWAAQIEPSVAMIIGPRACTDLGLDIASFAAHLTEETTATARTSSSCLLLTFPRSESRAEVLTRLVAQVGAERISHVFTGSGPHAG